MEKTKTYSPGKFIAFALVMEIIFLGVAFLLFQFGERWITGLRFDNKQYFILIPIGTLITFAYFFYTRWKAKAINKFADLELFNAVVEPYSISKHSIKFWLFRVALFLLAFACINPKIGSRLAEGKTKGMDIVFCLDVSNSMLAEDLTPNRLSKAKRMIEKVLDELNGDRIGLVVFAGEAFVQLPLTTDYGAARLFLSSLSPDVVPTQGTAIGSAIDLAFQSFDPESPVGKAIIVITDGENHEDDAGFAAKYANDNGIKVFGVGMGTIAGAPIPVNKGKKDFKRDNSGEIVVSKLNAALIEEIADKGNGLAIYASNSQQATKALIEELQQMEKGELDTVVYQDYEDRFQWFLLPSVLLLLIDALLGSRKNKWLNRLNLFSHEK
ncbi:VWA domain-containing protein [Luteibaculum oceani]|uniref:VWA domain-containing protein n=1 Tax=Luteibaculum oceani TaxID=1294296 RepID=A0A5C6UU88_9FLAO|nr:VWA domain-containing protein [Luteibaculum oceani]TXC76180.1 VWA domain-containing protein [Luteibaculum oceani]